MACLILDTALQGTMVVISAEDGRILATRESAQPYGQSEVLVPMIEEALAEAGIEYRDLTRIAAVKGPGAFTGLRVGLAAARSLKQVLKIPATGINSFDAIFKTYERKYGLKDGIEYVVLIETKRQDFYVQIYDGSKAEVMSAAQIAEKLRGRNVVLIGDAVTRFKADVEAFDCVEILKSDAEALAGLLDEGDDRLSPVYLRPADVNIPKKP